jgi:hypothetical protein
MEKIMRNIFHMKLEGLTTAAAASFLTVCGLKLTAGKVKLRKLKIGGSSEATTDVPMSWKVRRTNNTADGTKTTVALTNVTKLDALMGDTSVAAIGKQYTAEPTVKETNAVAGGTFNSGRGDSVDFGDDGPVAVGGNTLIVEVAPATATAVKFDLDIEWEG